MAENLRLHPDEREAIARRVVELLRDEASTPPDSNASQLLDARGVAQHFGLSREWVYDHAAELGAIRAGSGPRPRLRFEYERVAAGIAAMRGPAPAPCEAPAAPATRRHRRSAPAAELLPIRGRQA